MAHYDTVGERAVPLHAGHVGGMDSMRRMDKGLRAQNERETQVAFRARGGSSRCLLLAYRGSLVRYLEDEGAAVAAGFGLVHQLDVGWR